MLFTMSAQAQEFVRRIRLQPAQPPTAGLRIALPNTRDDGPLAVRAVREPNPDDLVVESEGARVYVDAAARERLKGRLLHVVALRDGRVQFRTRTLRSRTPDGAS